MSSRITILGSQENKLKDWLKSHPENHERGAIILFRRISRPVKNLVRSDRFIAVDIIKMEDDWVLDSSKTHFTINMRKFPEIYFRCESENLELGFAHNHPNGFPDFSEMDDVNERNILRGLSGCNGLDSYLVSLVLYEDSWIGRIRQGNVPENIIDVRHIIILGEKIELHNVKLSKMSPENLKRQETAFGLPFNQKLNSLRVVIVGLGGTGSPLATLLARTGVGELILIDGDDLESTNMNRVRGYVKEDVGKKKAKSLSNFINSLGLNTKVTPICGYLNNDTKALDALSSADVVFGCTDDISGRDFMNQAVYYYYQVLIDSGISGSIGNNIDGHPYLSTQKGRVSCILPEKGSCLRCQNVINEQKLYNEQRFKENPELINLDSETLEREHYIVGGGVQSPGIGAFTSAAADNAVATLMNLIRQFRNISGELRQDNIWIDFIHMEIHSNEPIDNSDCIYCRNQVILNSSEGKYRLAIPQLGEIPKHV